MSYLDILRGSTRTNAPAIMAGSFTSRDDAQRIARAREDRDYSDSADYRATRALMANRHGVCG